MKRAGRRRGEEPDDFVQIGAAAMGAMLDREEREELAARVIYGLLRTIFGEDTKSALQALQRCADRYQRACERAPDIGRRIDALMRSRPWIDSQRDYERISRIVARAAIIDEAELLPAEGEKLELLSALVAAYNAGQNGAHDRAPGP